MLKPFRLFRVVLSVLLAAGILATQLSCQNKQEKDQISIYSAVITQLATVDDTFGGNLKPPVLYVLKGTDERAGSVVPGQQANSVPIPDAVQAGISEKLEDLVKEFVWIDQVEDADWVSGPDSEVVGGGAIITLGNVIKQAEDKVQVAASIYIGITGAGGRTYVLTKSGRDWVITGTTGQSWTS